MPGDLASPASRQNRHDRPVRIEAVARGKLCAAHRRAHHIHQRMAHKIHRYAGITVDLLLEREDHHHLFDQPSHHADSSGAPRPHLRPDEVADGNPAILQPPRDAQVRSRRVDQNSQRRAALRCLGCQSSLHSNHRGNLVQHFGDPDHSHFMVIGNQFDARFGHARPAHAEKAGACALAKGRSQPRGIHIARRFAGRDENFRRGHAELAVNRGRGYAEGIAEAMRCDRVEPVCVSHRLALAANIRRKAPPGTGSVSSCSLYCSW